MMFPRIRAAFVEYREAHMRLKGAKLVSRLLEVTPRGDRQTIFAIRHLLVAMDIDAARRRRVAGNSAPAPREGSFQTEPDGFR